MRTLLLSVALLASLFATAQIDLSKIMAGQGVKVEDDKIADVSFQGSGCAISKASASLMTTVVKGKTPAEAARIFESFHRMVTGQGGPADDLPAKLAVFAGVREFPARVKCASLAWHALRNALEQAGTDQVSTE